MPVDPPIRPALPPAGRRGLGCLFFVMGFLAFFGVVGALVVGAGGNTSTDHVIEIEEESAPDARTKLAILDVSGVLLEGPGGAFSGPGVTGDVLAMLEHAEKDPDVGGVLLRLDTPGGSVTDADLIHRRVQALRKKGKKVVVLMGDVCASGGYYVAVAADAIWAMPTTITGSIGVMVATYNVYGLMQRLGVEDVSVTSGPNKAMLSPTRPQNPEERAILQGVVDSLHQRFVRLVAEGRGLTDEELAAVTDGRVLTAQQAVDAGLVDAVGYRDNALARLRELVGKGPYLVVRYAREASVFELLRREVTSRGHDARASALWQFFATPRAMYLMSPFAGLQ